MPRGASDTSTESSDNTATNQPPTYDGTPRRLPRFLAELEDWLPHQDPNYASLLARRTVTYRTKTYWTSATHLRQVQADIYPKNHGFTRPAPMEPVPLDVSLTPIAENPFLPVATPTEAARWRPRSFQLRKENMGLSQPWRSA